MPGRKVPLATNEVYHVFNRGINRQPTFTNRWELKRAYLTLSLYRFASPPVKLSVFLSSSNETRKRIIGELEKKDDKLISIYGFCFMPNHFHFLLKQVQDKGISKFMSNFQNSFTKYSNTRNERDGPLFLGQFKALRIETDEQLLHVHRYIHLNPYTSNLIDSQEGLLNYQWSSLPEFVGTTQKGICDKGAIFSFFKDDKSYKEFIINQSDYQRKLHKIKHLLLEK